MFGLLLFASTYCGVTYRRRWQLQQQCGPRDVTSCIRPAVSLSFSLDLAHVTIIVTADFGATDSFICSLFNNIKPFSVHIHHTQTLLLDMSKQRKFIQFNWVFCYWVDDIFWVRIIKSFDSTFSCIAQQSIYSEEITGRRPPRQVVRTLNSLHTKHRPAVLDALAVRSLFVQRNCSRVPQISCPLLAFLSSFHRSCVFASLWYRFRRHYNILRGQLFLPVNGFSSKLHSLQLHMKSKISLTGCYVSKNTKCLNFKFGIEIQ